MANLAAASGAKDVDDEELQLAKLNNALTILTEVFSDVHPEVFREMLTRFEGESGLEIVTNNLLASRDAWVKGRLRPTVEDANIPATADISEIPATDLFRRNSYKWAVKASLLHEFKSFSKSTVKAVLAEKNHSYTLARPVLQDIASKSWRHSINKFFSRWSRSTDDVSEKHAMIQWSKSPDGTHRPVLRETGDAELDHELHQTVLAPLLARYRAQQEADDQEIAEKINEEEATNADALFECGCCFGSSTFERIASCTESLHIICFECITRAINEALFGQSRAQLIDHDRGLLRCLVPTAGESCPGCIPHEIAQRAVYQAPKGAQTWTKFQSRLREQALTKAQIPLVRCPICSYAESTDLYLPPNTLRYSLNLTHPLLTLLCILFALPFLPIYLLFTHRPAIHFPSPLHHALARLQTRALFPARFRCRSPTCNALTCITCSQPWIDPHTCSSSSNNNHPTSLRTAIESARTLALKRTCPRCNTSFVKDSGCNKLTCPCGYTMCYICRQGLGAGSGQDGEGYRHFCQHFRVHGGRCGECDRCDLYGGDGEVEERERVEGAGRRAEREWRERWGMVKKGGGAAAGGVVNGENGGGGEEKGWTVQGWLDWWVERVVVVRERPHYMRPEPDDKNE